MARTKKSVIIAAAAAAKKNLNDSKYETVGKGQQYQMPQSPDVRQLRRKAKVNSVQKDTETHGDGVNLDTASEMPFRQVASCGRHSDTPKNPDLCLKLKSNPVGSLTKTRKHLPTVQHTDCRTTSKSKKDLSRNETCSQEQTSGSNHKREKRSRVKNFQKDADVGSCSILQEILADTEESMYRGTTANKKAATKSVQSFEKPRLQCTKASRRFSPKHFDSDKTSLRQEHGCECTNSSTCFQHEQCSHCPQHFTPMQIHCSHSHSTRRRLDSQDYSKQVSGFHPSSRHSPRLVSTPDHNACDSSCCLDSENCKIKVYQNVKQAIKILPKTTVMPIVCMEDILKEEATTERNSPVENKRISPCRSSPRNKKLVQFDCSKLYCNCENTCVKSRLDSTQKPKISRKEKCSGICRENHEQSPISEFEKYGSESLENDKSCMSKKKVTITQLQCSNKSLQKTSPSQTCSSNTDQMSPGCSSSPETKCKLSLSSDVHNKNNNLVDEGGISLSKSKQHRIRSPNSRYADDMILIPLVSPRRNRDVNKSARKSSSDKSITPVSRSNSSDSLTCKLSPTDFNVPAQLDDISPSSKAVVSVSQEKSVASSVVRELDFDQENSYCKSTLFENKQDHKDVVHLKENFLSSLIEKVNSRVIDTESRNLNDLLGSVDESLLINYDSDESTITAEKKTGESSDVESHDDLVKSSPVSKNRDSEIKKPESCTSHANKIQEKEDSTKEENGFIDTSTADNISLDDGVMELDYHANDLSDEFNSNRNIFDIFGDSEMDTMENQENADDCMPTEPPLKLTDSSDVNVESESTFAADKTGISVINLVSDDSFSEKMVDDEYDDFDRILEKSVWSTEKDTLPIVNENLENRNGHPNTKTENTDGDPKIDLEISGVAASLPGNSKVADLRTVPKRSTKQRLCYPRPITVLKHVEVSDSEPMSAFVSRQLDDYLINHKSEELSFSPGEFCDSCDLAFKEEYEPDFDEIDGLLFMSFSSEDALKAHIQVEKNTRLNPNIFFGMCRIKQLKEKQRRLQSQLHKKYNRISLLKTKRQVHQCLRGMHKRLESYRKLYRKEMKQILQCPSKLCVKMSQKTNDLTKLKGWRNKTFNSEKVDDPSNVRLLDSGSKLHWRTEEKLMRDLTPEDIKKMGIQFKKKRRKNLIYTKRKGMSKGVPSKHEGKRRFAKSHVDMFPVYDGMDLNEDFEVEDATWNQNCSPVEAGTTKDEIPLNKQRRRLRMKAMHNLNLSDEDQLILKKIGGFGELKVVKRKKANLNLIHLNRSMAIAAVSALQIVEPDMDLKDEHKSVSLVSSCGTSRMCSPVEQNVNQIQSNCKNEIERQDKTVFSDMQASDSVGGSVKGESWSNYETYETDHFHSSVSEQCDKPEMQASDSVGGSVKGESWSNFETYETDRFHSSVSEQCDKPGCRYGCICHLCHLAEGLDDETHKPKSSHCEKEYCMLGCICDSIAADKLVREKSHCGKMECMLKCICEIKQQSFDNALSPPPFLPATHDEIHQDSYSNPDEIPPLVLNEVDILKDCSSFKPKRKSRSSPKVTISLPVREKTYRLAKNLDAISRKAMMVYETSEMYTEQKRKKKKKETDDISIITKDLKPISRKEPQRKENATIVIEDDEMDAAEVDPSLDVGHCARTMLYVQGKKNRSLPIKSCTMDASKKSKQQISPVSEKSDVPCSIQARKRQRTLKEDDHLEPAKKAAILDTEESLWKTQMVCLKAKKKISADSEKNHSDVSQLNLLEIMSNCDWEHSKTHILSKISQLISKQFYPIPQKLRWKDFVLEILPKADKPATIPPELQKALPKGMFSVRVKVVKENFENKNVIKDNIENAKMSPAIACSASDIFSQLKKNLNKSDIDKDSNEKTTEQNVSFCTKLNNSNNVQEVSVQSSDFLYIPQENMTDITCVTKDQHVAPALVGPTGISGLSQLQINRPAGRCTMGSMQESSGNVSSESTAGMNWKLQTTPATTPNNRVNVTFNMKKINLSGTTLRLKPGVDVNTTPQGLVISGPMALKMSSNVSSSDTAATCTTAVDRFSAVDTVYMNQDPFTVEASNGTGSHPHRFSVANNDSGTITAQSANAALPAQGFFTVEKDAMISSGIIPSVTTTASNYTSSKSVILANPSNEQGFYSTSTEKGNVACLEGPFGSDSCCIMSEKEPAGVNAGNVDRQAPACIQPSFSAIPGQAIKGSGSLPVPVTLIGPFSKPVRLLPTASGSSSVIHLVSVTSASTLGTAPIHVSQAPVIAGKSQPNYIAVPVTFKPQNSSKTGDILEIRDKTAAADRAISSESCMTDCNFQTLVYADPVTKCFIPVASTEEDAAHLDAEFFFTKLPKAELKEGNIGLSENQRVKKHVIHKDEGESEIESYQNDSGYKVKRKKTHLTTKIGTDINAELGIRNVSADTSKADYPKYSDIDINKNSKPDQHKVENSDNHLDEKCFDQRKSDVIGEKESRLNDSAALLDTPSSERDQTIDDNLEKDSSVSTKKTSFQLNFNETVTPDTNTDKVAECVSPSIENCSHCRKPDETVSACCFSVSTDIVKPNHSLIKDDTNKLLKEGCQMHYENKIVTSIIDEAKKDSASHKDGQILFSIPQNDLYLSKNLKANVDCCKCKAGKKPLSASSVNFSTSKQKESLMSAKQKQVSKPCDNNETESMQNVSSNSADSDTTAIYVESDNELDAQELGHTLDRRVVIVSSNNDISKNDSSKQNSEQCSFLNEAGLSAVDISHDSVVSSLGDCKKTVKNKEFQDNFSEIGCEQTKHSEVFLNSNSNDELVSLENTNIPVSKCTDMENNTITLVSRDTELDKKINANVSLLDGNSMSEKISCSSVPKEDRLNKVFVSDMQCCEVSFVETENGQQIQSVAEMATDGGIQETVNDLKTTKNNKLPVLSSVVGSKKRKAVLVPRQDYEHIGKIFEIAKFTHDVAHTAKSDKESSKCSTGEELFVQKSNEDEIIDILGASEDEGDVDIESVGSSRCLLASKEHLSHVPHKLPEKLNFSKNKRKPLLISIINPALDDDIEFTEEVLLVDEKKVSRSKEEKVTHSHREKARRVEQHKSFAYLRQVVFAAFKTENEILTQHGISKVHLLSTAIETISQLEKCSNNLASSLEYEANRCCTNQQKMFQITEDFLRSGISSQQIQGVLSNLQTVPFHAVPHPAIRMVSYDSSQFTSSNTVTKCARKNVSEKGKKIIRLIHPVKTLSSDNPSVFKSSKQKYTKTNSSKPEIYIDYAEDEFCYQSMNEEPTGFVLASGFVEDMPDVQLPQHRPAQIGFRSAHLSTDINDSPKSAMYKLKNLYCSTDTGNGAEVSDMIHIEPIHNNTADCHAPKTESNPFTDIDNLTGTILNRGVERFNMAKQISDDSIKNVDSSGEVPSQVRDGIITLSDAPVIQPSNGNKIILVKKTNQDCLQQDYDTMAFQSGERQGCVDNTVIVHDILSENEAISITSEESVEGQFGVTEGVDDTALTTFDDL